MTTPDDYADGTTASDGDLRASVDSGFTPWLAGMYAGRDDSTDDQPDEVTP